MIIYSHEGASGATFNVHKVETGDGFVAYLMHTRNKSDVAYHAMDREDLQQLRDALDSVLEGSAP